MGHHSSLLSRNSWAVMALRPLTDSALLNRGVQCRKVVFVEGCRQDCSRLHDGTCFIGRAIILSQYAATFSAARPQSCR